MSSGRPLERRTPLRAVDGDAGPLREDLNYNYNYNPDMGDS